MARKHGQIADGTLGVIMCDDHSACPYKVLFEGEQIPLWTIENEIVAAPDEKLPSKPTRELKVGDKVRIKSREWYEANKNERGIVNVPCSFIPTMARFCGQTFEIAEIFGERPSYKLKNTGNHFFSKEMFDLDEPTGESAFTEVCKALKAMLSLLTSDSKSVIKENLPLIKTNKLLTNIKLD